jgi:tetratricopeptide (TPR) repeat protein
MQKKSSLSLLLLILNFLIVTSIGQTADRLLEKAHSEASLGRFESALDLYSEFRRMNPNDPRSNIYSARVMVQAGQTHDAEIELGEVLGKVLEDGQIAFEVAELLLRLERPQFVPNVLNSFYESGKIGPKSMHLLAKSYLQQRLFDRSLAILDRMADTYTLSEEALLTKGNVLVGLNRLNEALETFELVAQRNPNSAEAFDGLSLVSLRGNNPEAAKEMAMAAVDLSPENATYLHQLGQACKALQQEEDAILYMERAVEAGGTGAQIYFDLGDSYRKTGEIEKARQALQDYQSKLNDLRKDQEITQFIAQGEQALAENSMERAKEAFLKVLNLDGKDWIAHNRLAKIYLSSGKMDQALTHLRMLLEIDNKSSEAHFLNALYWYDKKDLSKAMEAAAAARKLRPGHAETRNLLGNLYLIAGEKESALNEYQAAKELAPGRADYQKNYDLLSKSIPSQ